MPHFGHVTVGTPSASRRIQVLPLTFGFCMSVLYSILHALSRSAVPLCGKPFPFVDKSKTNVDKSRAGLWITVLHPVQPAVQ